jgi:hypothetical protein
MNSKTFKMKAKLIKTDSDSHHNGHYFLNDEEGFAIGSTDYEWCRRVAAAKPQYKLSKENCDEIFGVVNVEKLANEESYKAFKQTVWINGFKDGFNKAIELNRDKVFTIEDMKKAFELGYDASADTYMTERKEKEFEILIQQPTEISVIIETCDSFEETSEVYIDEVGSGNYFSHSKKPKLDAEGCLILKKI